MIYSFHSFHWLKSQLSEDAAEWLEWGSWTQCTSSCGLGTKLRARQCSKPLLGDNETCPGNATEARECTLKTCQGDRPIPRPIFHSHLIYHISQLLTVNGKSGVSGPNVRQLATSATKGELERAVNLSLVAVQRVQGRPRKSTIAYCLAVQVECIPTMA